MALEAKQYNFETKINHIKAYFKGQPLHKSSEVNLFRAHLKTTDIDQSALQRD